MKGFVACCLASAPALAEMGLRRPVHLALSYDEEVGCTGVGPMAEWIGYASSPGAGGDRGAVPAPAGQRA